MKIKVQVMKRREGIFTSTLYPREAENTQCILGVDKVSSRWSNNYSKICNLFLLKPHGSILRILSTRTPFSLLVWKIFQSWCPSITHLSLPLVFPPHKINITITVIIVSGKNHQWVLGC